MNLFVGILLAVGVGMFFSHRYPPKTPVANQPKPDACKSDFDYLFGDRLFYDTFENHGSKSTIPNFSHPLFLN